ncbi:MAG: bifunctional demethylmenaquinone methyltransferase/2-methoxy-6-polyprenyl-1,4-benzoquinol methylase UbiE [Candidatus Gastranaerophilales bacterium]|nr:bifunctional demethylmenaquinone methyltransferase/2-methoxy-6-polyprenyl-1,4-benzoquinol methylase UbiE [Candidatus Gastranaerophilales bacterium]
MDSKKPELVKEMFNRISNDYDKLNDIMSFGLHRFIKKDIIKNLGFKNAKILDLCTGTGDLAGILKARYPQSQVTGVDFSPNMLEIAKKKNPRIEFLQADCTQLPFENESFDLCVISFGLRNIEEMEKAISEIYRVLKKGGIFINLDLGKPNKFFNFFLKPYMYLWIATMGKFFHGDETPYKYLAVSNETFPSPEELIKIYEKTGFSNIKNKNYLFGQIAAQKTYKVKREM